MKNTSTLYIITGPAGVGKTTVSAKIAEQLNKSVLIEGDTIYNFFVGGRIKPWYENAPLELFWKNCIYLIKSYLEEGYDVVFNYIINPKKFEELSEIFKDYKIVFKVLLVDEKTIVLRDQQRDVDCRMNERSLVLLKKFVEYNFDNKYILNITNLSVEETVNEIMKK